MPTKDLNKRVESKFSLKGMISLVMDKKDLSKIEIAPYRDWRMVGIGFFLMLLVSFGFNMYLLFKVNNDNFFTVSQSDNQETSFNREGLARVLGLITTREGTFEGLKTGVIKITDPSL